MELSPFLESCGVVVDVRSPAEYRQGTIPSAYNIPLLSDDERAQVGTLYKREGQQLATELGMKFVIPKLSSLISSAKELLEQLPTGDQTVKLFCARGGLRSLSLCHYLLSNGIEALTLKGGYKTYRRSALLKLQSPLKLLVLGGYTGSGKSAILKLLKEQGEQVIDLEELAVHRGSVFGAISAEEQPTNEQFENLLAYNLEKLDLSKMIWIEDESRLLGRVKIPDPLYNQIRTAPIIVLKRTIEDRLEQIEQDYLKTDLQQLRSSIYKIEKRLGKERTEAVIRAFDQKEYVTATRDVLHYYDSCYNYGLEKREKQSIQQLNLSGGATNEMALPTLKKYREMIDVEEKWMYERPTKIS